jgi:hypothetical protein
MKRTNILIAGAAFAGLALAVYLYVMYRRDHHRPRRSHPSNSLANNIATMPQPFTGLNWYAPLYEGVKSWEAIALQKMLQYYDSSVAVTGVISARDAEIIKDVTGRSTTNLNEFRYSYFSIRFTDEAAQKIFESVNG